MASLCCHLDGIPLAIELAAARVRSLSVEEIDSKLDQRFRLLTGGSRTVLLRHQTLRSLIDWSYDLLNDPERSLLRQLSVFAGGWTLAAGERVCAAEGMENWAFLDQLTSLADKSLVVAEQMDGRSRYRLLETVRQYARDRLVECGGSEAVRRRHRDYFLTLAEEAEPKLKGAEQAMWLQGLEEEHENLRIGLEWSLVEEGSGSGLRQCGALQQFWVTRGHLSEGRAWCGRVLDKPGAEDRTPERAKVLHVDGGLAFHLGDFSDARARFEESLAIRRQLGDLTAIAASLNGGGIAAGRQGDFASARAMMEESLAIRRQLGERGGIANSLNNLGNVAHAQGDYPTARVIYEESLAIMRKLGDGSAIAVSLFNLGNVACEQGDYLSARALADESLAISRELQSPSGIANALECLGNVALEQGDLASGRTRYLECLAIGRELEDRLQIAYSLEGLAALVAGLGAPLSAARLWGAMEQLRGEIGSPLPPNDQPRYDRRVAAARAVLRNDAAFAHALDEGRALPLEEAIEIALKETIERKWALHRSERVRLKRSDPEDGALK